MKLSFGVGLAVAGVALGASLHAMLFPPKKENPVSSEAVSGNTYASLEKPCPYNIKRLSGFSYTKPLVFAEPQCESASYGTLHHQLDSIISKLKAEGILDDAAVYVRDFNKGEWLSANDTGTFNPGSMLKLPLLLALVRSDEMNPGFLNQTVAYQSAKSPETLFPQTFDKQTILPLKQYSLRDLCQAMIEHSDNIATTLLNKRVSDEVFQQVFKDLDLPAPKIEDASYRINARQASVFMKAIYNASYLNIPNSEKVGYLLTTSQFKQGICAGLPKEIGAAHKFGESGTKDHPELHETALVYLPGAPYLITMMTRGKDVQKLPKALERISELIYRSMEKRSSFAPNS